MANPLSEAEIYQVARKRVEEKKGFYTHLASYVVVNAMLVIIWAITNPGYPWFIWPLAGWGIGVIFHFLGVFAFNKGTAWESKEIEKEAERLRKEGTGK
jgi:hypothetical protein